MENFEKVFADKEITNIDFMNVLSGAYCYKKDINGNIIEYAYISSSFQLITVKNLNTANYNIYDLDSQDINKVNESKHAICEFLGELTLAPILKHGKMVEKEMAKTLWKLFNPQKRTPKDLISFVQNLKNSNI